MLRNAHFCCYVLFLSRDLYENTQNFAHRLYKKCRYVFGSSILWRTYKENGSCLNFLRCDYKNPKDASIILQGYNGVRISVYCRN
jgi:hypothetical protein